LLDGVLGGDGCAGFFVGGGFGKQEYADVEEIAVALGVVEAVADDEFVRDLETGVVGVDIGDAAVGLVKEDGDLEIFGFALLEDAEKVFEGHAGVEDVFDDDDGAAVDAGIEIAGESDLAAGVRALAVAGDGDEVEGNFAADLSGEVGQKEDGTFENADEVEGFVGKVGADLFGDVGDAAMNGGAGDEDADVLAFAGVDEAAFFGGDGGTSVGLGDSLTVKNIVKLCENVCEGSSDFCGVAYRTAGVVSRAKGIGGFGALTPLR